MNKVCSCFIFFRSPYKDYLSTQRDGGGGGRGGDRSRGASPSRRVLMDITAQVPQPSNLPISHPADTHLPNRFRKKILNN